MIEDEPEIWVAGRDPRFGGKFPRRDLQVRPFQAGFLVFSDFQRGPLRLPALMRLPVVHIYTHDSISMGEDGPTHQPVEQLASLRAMPGVVDLRPADANEIREAWRVLLPITDRPVALVLGKQEAPVIDRARYAPASGLARGGYVLADPPGGRIRAVEQAAALGWERWTGAQGTIIGMRSFGASGPGHEVRRHFGFTAGEVAGAVRACLARVGAAAGTGDVQAGRRGPAWTS